MPEDSKTKKKPFFDLTNSWAFHFIVNAKEVM